MNVNNHQLADLYVDYLLASTRQTTATGFSELTQRSVSHDKITRMLDQGKSFNSKTVWLRAKPLVREFETHDGCISIDDSIQEKPYSDESELICWHFDHTKNRSVKGVNFITAFYNHRELAVPLGVEFVRKKKFTTDSKTGKTKRVSEKTKNDVYRDLLRTIEVNQVKYQYVLNDTWYSSSENMLFVKKYLNKDFVMAIKSNRLVALSEQDKLQGKYIGIEALNIEGGTIKQVWLEQLDFPVVLVKQVFKNEDGSTGILYLVCSDLDLNYDSITAIYQKRWKVEEFHKSVKQNASFAKSPTKIVASQLSHFYASIIAYIRLEWLKFKNNMNHFALKTKIYRHGLKTAFDQIRDLSTSSTH